MVAILFFNLALSLVVINAQILPLPPQTSILSLLNAANAVPNTTADGSNGAPSVPAANSTDNSGSPVVLAVASADSTVSASGPPKEVQGRRRGERGGPPSKPDPTSASSVKSFKANDFQCIDDTKFKHFTSANTFVTGSCPPGLCFTRNQPSKNPCIGKDRARAIDGNGGSEAGSSKPAPALDGAFVTPSVNALVVTSVAASATPLEGASVTASVNAIDGASVTVSATALEGASVTAAASALDGPSITVSATALDGASVTPTPNQN